MLPYGRRYYLHLSFVRYTCLVAPLSSTLFQDIGAIEVLQLLLLLVVVENNKTINSIFASFISSPLLSIQTIILDRQPFNSLTAFGSSPRVSNEHSFHNMVICMYMNVY